MKHETIVVPQIHMNGSGGKHLLEGYRAGIDALSEAIETINAITVHGRDYYTISDTAIIEAKAQHAEMLQELLSCKQFLKKIILGIYDQVI
jgi:hypothetical protein